MYQAEAEGLRALRAAGVRAPEPYAHGIEGAQAYLEMERLDLGGPADWPALARMLARLHRNTGPEFGWETDNWIGLSPQKNAWSRDWIGFYRDFRLRPQLHRARMLSDAEPVLENLERFFAGYRPAPSLLHGDLWRGNAGFLSGGAPVVFDPAVYYGDREADLAMSELFGGFPAAFYAAYREAWALNPGYETRRPLYNLYHLLNHLNLFGASYLGEVNATLRLLLRSL
ncbi:MAG: fructosamine kinase family protein [Betaproteobacteria bacterium]|nr:fructosamine kinase family protein [Betaproteobacteria bacterium]